MSSSFASAADVCAQAAQMQEYFQTGATLPLAHRKEALINLRTSKKTRNAS